MVLSWLILADDLTGAADCAIAFAKSGFSSSVIFDGSQANTEVVSVDVGSRPFEADKASALHRNILNNYYSSKIRVYKKIDSTLRGQPAAETAETIAFLKKNQAGSLAVVAPAFPATGRVTKNGSVFVNQVPLEKTSIWERDHTYLSGNLSEILTSENISNKVISLETIRKGVNAVQNALCCVCREGISAVICDATEDEDLNIIAEATLRESSRLFWVGTGGLAAALARQEGSHKFKPVPISQRAEGVLVVVGSLAEASRESARQIVEEKAAHPISISPDIILDNDTLQLADCLLPAKAILERGENVLVEVGLENTPNLEQGFFLMQNLSVALRDTALSAGGLIATGGDTAYGLLKILNVSGIQLIDEVESGVPAGLTIGDMAIPIVTKAGGFGTKDTLLKALNYIHEIKKKGSF